MKPFRKLAPLAAVAGMLISSGTTQAAAIVYESFTYTAGTINNTQGGGTGFDVTSNWTGSASNNQFSVVGSGLGFGSLSTNGGSVDRLAAPGGAEIHRTLDSAVANTLTSSTSYFSALVRTDYFSIGNENLSFAFGTSDILTHSGAPNTSGGEALGFVLDGVGSTIFFGPSAFEGTLIGNTYGFDAATVVMLVGEIQWNAASGDDLLTLYAASGGSDGTTGSTDWSSFTNIGTVQADYDETAFNTLHIAGQQVSSMDEIRLGLSFEDVGVTNVVPEPSTAILGGLGLLALLRRRRA